MADRRAAAVPQVKLARLRPFHWDLKANRVESTDWRLVLEPGPTSLPGHPGLVSSGWRDGVGFAGSSRNRTDAGRGCAVCGVAPGVAPEDIVMRLGGSWGFPWEETCYMVRRVR